MMDKSSYPVGKDTDLRNLRIKLGLILFNSLNVIFNY